MKLHIGNLPRTLTDAQLKELVVKIAEPSSLEIARDRGGESKGFGFAEFADADRAQAVIKGLDGTTVGGMTLKVSEARPRKSDAPRA